MSKQGKREHALGVTNRAKRGLAAVYGVYKDDLQLAQSQLSK